MLYLKCKVKYTILSFMVLPVCGATPAVSDDGIMSDMHDIV